MTAQNDQSIVDVAISIQPVASRLSHCVYVCEAHFWHKL